VSSAVATIVVVTFNSRRWLARQRAALEALTETRWRLVVLDNGSREDERPKAEMLPAGAVIIQCERNAGFAEGNNLAALDTDTPYLVFLNPDAFPQPAWLSSLIKAAEDHPRAGAVGSTQLRADTELYDGTGDVLHATGIAYRSSYGKRRLSPPPFGETFAACAAAMLVRREAFEAVGGFDGGFFCYMEDVDLCFRLRLAGWSVLQSPDAVVAHIGGGAPNTATGFADFHGARNRFWTFVKCMPAALFWPLLPLHLIASIAAVAFALRRGPHAWGGFLAGLGSIGQAWRARRAVQATRHANSLDIARALAWSPFVFLGRQPVIRRPR